MRCLICVFLAVGLAAGCAAPEGPSRTIGVGAVIDRTGNNSEPSWEDAIRLAELHANEGMKQSGLFPEDVGFKIHFADSANEPALAVERCTKLVREEGVRALVLDTSQVDVAVNELFYDADPGNDLDVPMQCGSCTSGTINNPAATGANPVNEAALRNALGWNFRSIMSTKLMSKILIDLVQQAGNAGDLNGDGKFKIAYLASDEVFGRGTVKDLKTYAAQMFTASAPIIEEIYHARDADPNSHDWAGEVQKLTDSQTDGVTDGFPDVVMVANFAQQQAAFVKAYRQSGSSVRLLHYHTFRISAALQSLGSLANGVEGVSHVLLDNEDSGETFARSFEEQYGVPVVYRDAIYYDSAYTLLLAAAMAALPLEDPTQVAGAQIREAMTRTSAPGGEVVRTGPEEFARALQWVRDGRSINYEGASGPMDYDATGNVRNRIAQYRAQSGRFVDVARFDCVGSQDCPVMP